MYTFNGEKKRCVSCIQSSLAFVNHTREIINKTMNNNGPRTDPWATPTSISWESEIAPLTGWYNLAASSEIIMEPPQLIVTDTVHFKFTQKYTSVNSVKCLLKIQIH